MVLIASSATGTVVRSLKSTVSLGTTATPRPALTIPWTVPLSSGRKTKSGLRPAERVRLERLHERQARKPMSGSSQISSSDGALRRAASGELGLHEGHVRVVEQVQPLERAVPRSEVRDR